MTNLWKQIMNNHKQIFDAEYEARIKEANEKKLAEAKARLGNKWHLHPDNNQKRLDTPRWN